MGIFITLMGLITKLQRIDQQRLANNVVWANDSMIFVAERVRNADFVQFGQLVQKIGENLHLKIIF